MFDFGDELTLEIYRIPWLIWIQIFVMLLLMVLLYCFSIFALDLEGGSFSASSSMSRESSLKKHNGSTVLTDCFHLEASRQAQSGNIKGEIATGTSTRVVRGENVVGEREGYPSKDANCSSYHPCHYIRLAKLAFLKCLGLDSSENSSNSEQTPER